MAFLTGTMMILAGEYVNAIARHLERKAGVEVALTIAGDHRL